MRKIVILGSTGSIGRQALEIISAHPDKFQVIALAAGGASYQELAEQANRFKVPIVGAVTNGAVPFPRENKLQWHFRYHASEVFFQLYLAPDWISRIR